MCFTASFGDKHENYLIFPAFLFAFLFLPCYSMNVTLKHAGFYYVKKKYLFIIS